MTNSKIRDFFSKYSKDLQVSTHIPIFRKFEFKNLKINPAYLDGEIEPDDSNFDTDERKSNYSSLDDNEQPEFSMFEMI